MSFRPDSIPRRRPGAEGQRFGEDFVVLDAEGRMLRGLNDTAARVWELCDGKRTAREVAEVVAREYGAEVEPVLADCLHFLARLGGQGLMEELLEVRR